MSAINNIKLISGGGMDTNSAPAFVAKNDYISAFNFRTTGTTEGEEGDGSNPESTQLITSSLPAGINKGIGGGSFEDIGKVVTFKFNSFGNCQITSYDSISKAETVIYTDVTDSGGATLLPLNPQNYIKALLVNQTYLFWVATGLEVGYTNLNTLASGGYGTVLAEDLSLLKPQCLIPPTGVYGNDLGQPANYLYGNLPQFIVQYVNADFNFSAWSTWSKRIVPYQQNTPTLGADVTQNNYIIVSVNIGSIRAATINIGCRFSLDNYSIIKSVNRTYIIALPNTLVDISNEISEAYDPTTNIYSFAFYNNTIAIPIDPTQTDLAYDYIWPANAIGILNTNIVSLSNLQVGHQRPTTPVSIGAVGYNPNIGIPSGTYTDPLTNDGNLPGSSGSGAGDHRRIMTVFISGTPHTGDTIFITTADIRNSSVTIAYPPGGYTVPSSQNGNLLAVVNSIAEILPSASYVLQGSIYRIDFIGQPFYGLIQYAIQLFFSGATVANSIPSELDNSVYQMALSLRDGPGARFFPLESDNTFIIQTPSYAQVNGQAIQLTWQINNPIAPMGAYDYQWLTTKPPITQLLDVITALLSFKGTWDAHTNTPTLAVNVGTVGDVYQITTPSLPTDTINLGAGGPYNTGDYVVYNGQSWDILQKSFGDLTATGNILAFNLNSLNLYVSEYNEQGVNTVLSYDFAAGDRCTLHYWIDTDGNKNYFNNPCVNLSVLGYDSGLYIVKVENSAAFTVSSGNILYNGQQINDRNIFMRLYSPAKEDQTVSTTLNGTVWYEIGERFTITNGMYDTLKGVITDGGVYYKTRQYADALNPYSSDPIQVLATDLNYSDFYVSPYYSFGRPRTYNDELIETERKAITAISESYVLGSMNNGLTRFYPANVYGEGQGQTSSSFGGIQFTWQRGDIFIIVQELNIFYVPVNWAYQQLNTELTGVAISSKLLNNGRYETKGIGIGTTKEAFCYNENWAALIDPNRSEPFEVTVGGVDSISGKMSKYFKQVFALAYSQGKKIVLFYNRYYDEVMCCIEADGGVLTFFPFSADGWNPFNNYNIVPTDVTSTPNPADATASYDNTTGLVTYTPTTNFVGNTVATFTFLVDGVPITRNLCLNWTAGDENVNSFSFMPKINQALSTTILSNIIGVGGNNIPSPISITGDPGAQYSINGGSFTSSPGTVNAGDSVQVEVESSASNSTLTSCTLTIDSQSATFDVTTLASGGTSTPMSILSTIISGAVQTQFAISMTVSVDLNITYSITYVDSGVSSFLGTGSATIVNGTLIGDGTVSYGGDFSTWTSITCTLDFGSPSPNPAGGVTIIYTSPHTDIV